MPKGEHFQTRPLAYVNTELVYSDARGAVQDDSFVTLNLSSWQNWLQVVFTLSTLTHDLLSQKSIKSGWRFLPPHVVKASKVDVFCL